MTDEPQPAVVIPMPIATLEPDMDISEDHMAIVFAEKYKHLMRYEGYRNRWFKWSGHRWEVDHKMACYSLARRVTRDIADQYRDFTIKIAVHDLGDSALSKDKSTVRKSARRSVRNMCKGLKSAKSVHAVVSLARCDAKLTAEFRQWDADPWLLNTPEGTVDLKTGEVRGHRAVDYITKVCAVSPAWGQPKRWLQFLHEITEGDTDMVDYLQRMMGYCITGVTVDHALFYTWGRGQNGKTTILETLGRILGDYWIESPPQAFIVSGGDRHETEIARMHNVRLVTSDELPQGKEWDTSKVKRLTGGATISARFMRQDYFEFHPQFKLLMAGNDKPALKQVDDAIRRRFNLIPFSYKVPDSQKDKNLHLKLEAEAPEILGWIIQGCLAWQSVGLKPPKVVVDATDEYLMSEDNMTQWFEECCTKTIGCFCTTTELYQSWLGWCKANEEHPGSRKGFSQHLTSKGPIFNIQKKKTMVASGFTGVELLQTPSKKNGP
jgi:putative DNA primase/helicase